MSILVEFKKEIKIRQVKDRKILHAMEKEAEEMGKRITKITTVSPEIIELEFPILYKEIISSRKFKEFMASNQSGPFLIDLNEFLREVVSNHRAVYNANQSIINAMDNEKIINYIDLERLFVHLSRSKLSFEQTFKIFSLAVGFDIKYIKNHGINSQKNGWIVELFEEFFALDGSLLLNADVAHFRGLLAMLSVNYVANYRKYNDDSILENGKFVQILEDIDKILNAYVSFLSENNEKHKTEDLLQEKSRKSSDSEITISNVPRVSLEKLKKYYKNGKIICVPENLESFTNLLDECGIELNEKRYILGLVNDFLAKEKEIKVLKYLTVDDRGVYQRAVDILNGLHHTNSDYYILIQLIDDIKALGDLLEESLNDEEKEEILAEIQDLFIALRDILNKYTEDKLTENNILFLCDEFEVPYLKTDCNRLDGSFYKMICSGIRKIRKDNQGNFRLVMTSDNMPYRTYDILSSKVHLSFIEVTHGIYLIVGVDSVSQGYDEIVKRVINNEEKIRKIEGLVKDENTRNNILATHEAYLSLFNPDDLGIARKKVE